MNGRTHEMAAAASAVAVMHGSDSKSLVLGTMVALMAGTLPDIDLVDNRKGKGLKMVMEVIKQAIIPIGMAVYYGSDIYQIAIWMSLCIFLVLQPHRGFSHSIWCMGVMCGTFVWLTSETYMTWFLIGYGSHLVLDLLNTKDVALLYPKGFCLKAVKAGGLADDVIGTLAAGIFAIVILFRFVDIDLINRVVMAIHGG